MSSLPAHAPVVEVLAGLRENVTGLNETVLSTVDGLAVAADADTVCPDSVAALCAASHSLSLRLAQEVGGGPLREVITRSAGRCIIIETVGERALLTVVGDEGLDLLALRRELRRAVERLEEILRADSPA
ncbi:MULTISPECIES: roadblock/LC7 domain-containing protein [unclassified Streptomyces]|uniref:roadblock/LC7 domain-containing protein n=1 Tax=unclassified Streptomyces TaxID=2593676 RepID=UPI0036EA029D